jgi:hypothetical protein
MTPDLGLQSREQLAEGLRDSLREQLQHLRNDTERIGAMPAGYPNVPIIHAANIMLLEYLTSDHPAIREVLNGAVDAACDELARVVLERMGR